MRASTTFSLLLGWFLFVPGPTAGWAQFGQPEDQNDGPKRTFTGVVLDEKSGEPVPSVTLWFDSLETGTLSNLEGEFRVDLPLGTWGYRIQMLGYELYQDTVVVQQFGKMPPVEIVLTGEEITTDAVTIEYVNPAIRIIKNAIANKPNNRPGQLPPHAYRSYHKLNVILNQVDSQKIEKNLLLRPFKSFIESKLDNPAYAPDSNGNRNITVFVTESITDVYKAPPNQAREIVRAVKSSGFEGDEANLLADNIVEVNFYENYVDLLGKEFVSPLNRFAFLNYEFAKMNEEIQEDGDTLFQIELRPRNKFDLAFRGNIWIESGTWALQRIKVNLNQKPDMNFVEDIHIEQEFTEAHGPWVPTHRGIELDIANRKQGFGLLGVVNTYYTNYTMDTTYPDGFFQQAALAVDEGVREHDSTFWAENRPVALDSASILGYELIDDLSQKPIWKFFKFTGNMIRSGGVRVGNVYIGPLTNLVSFNQTEGWRFQVGAFSHPDLHPRWNFDTWLAYGVMDKRFKYRAFVGFKPSISPKVEIIVGRTDALEQAGFADFLTRGNSFLFPLLRRQPVIRLNYFQENFLAVDWNITKGVAGRFYGRTKAYQPAFDFGFREPGEPIRKDWEISELGVRFRFSIKEDYILKYNEKVYKHTPWPILYLDYAAGLNNVLGSDFSYHHLSLAINNRADLGRLGWLNYTIKLGQVFGTLPFPSLYVFEGSQSFAMNVSGYASSFTSSLAGRQNRSAGYREVGYNLMYFYEFSADRYLSIGYDYHLAGFLWRKIPLLRRLKFRLIQTGRLAWGSLSKANRQFNSLTEAEAGFSQTVQAPNRVPYIELGVGVENVLKILRIDYVWRLTYKNPEVPEEFEGRQLNHGPRFQLSITF